MIDQIQGPDGQALFVPSVINSVTASLCKGEYWEPYLLPLFPLCCSPSAWTIEVGAYIGDHTIALLQHGPVIAFEPQAMPWALLGLNLASRRFKYEWSTQQVALYSRVRTLEPAHECWQEPHHPSNAYKVGKPCGTWAQPLDALPHGRLKIGFLKVDAQGCDLHVLQGAEDAIQKTRPIILCEFEPTLAQLHGDDADDYRIWFRQHLYAFRGFLGGNILGIPHEREAEPFWQALINQGIELTT